MTKKGVTTLEQFVAQAGAREPWWRSNIPEEFLEQIMSSDAGAAVIARWLTSVGIQGATRAKLETLLIYRNEHRG